MDEVIPIRKRIKTNVTQHGQIEIDKVPSFTHTVYVGSINNNTASTFIEKWVIEVYNTKKLVIKVLHKTTCTHKYAVFITSVRK